MSEASTQGLLTGFNLLVACTLISLAIFLMTTGRNLASAFSSKLANVNSNIANDDLVAFDGTTVSGADVVTCIKKNSSKVEIIVHKLCGPNTSTAKDVTWSSKSLTDGKFRNYPSYAYDDMHWDPAVQPNPEGAGGPLADGQIYINPNAKFLGSITRNANGAISQLIFAQTEYHQDAYEVPEAGNTTVVINNANSGTSSDIAAAISALQSTAVSLNDAIQYLQSTGDVSSITDIQAQTLAILQTLSDEVLPGMSNKIDAIGATTGGDPDISSKLEDIQSTVSQVYTMLNNAAGGAPGSATHNVDEIYDQVSMVSKAIDGVSQQLINVSSQISQMSLKLSEEHSTIIAKIDKMQQTLDNYIEKTTPGAGSGVEPETGGEAGTASTGSLKESLSASTISLNNMQEFEKQYNQLKFTMGKLANSYNSLSTWLKENPGGNV